MALTYDRTRESARGLGRMELRQIEPTEEVDFSTIGYLDDRIGVEIADYAETDEIIADNGVLVNVITRNRVLRLSTGLKQSSIEEINLLRNAGGKVYAIRYWGQSHTSPERYQYYVINKARINPSVELQYKPGQRIIPFKAWALNPDDDYNTPEYYICETRGRIEMSGLRLWLSPRHGYGYLTQVVHDVSGRGNVGMINSSRQVWQTDTTPEKYLKLQHTGSDTDTLTIGDSVNDNGESDLYIALWLRIDDSNGVMQDILSKKSSINDDSEGYCIYRDTSNHLNFKLSDSDNSAIATTSAQITQGQWVNAAIAVNRTGQAQWYINGVASGSPVAVASIGSGENSEQLTICRSGAMSIGDLRIYQGSSSNPTINNMSLMAQEQFNAERVYYGI